MKGLITVLGLIFAFVLMTTPAYSVSLQFDLDGNPDTGDEWPMIMSIGQTVNVDVWLTGYNEPADVYTVSYSFTHDTDLLEVTNAWSNDTDHGGPWQSACSFADYINGSYTVVSDCEFFPFDGVDVIDKVKLHTIELRCIASGEGLIETQFAILFDVNFMTYNPENIQATIKGPCKITIDPADVLFPGETIQFTAMESGDCVEPTNLIFELEVNECGSTITPAGLYTAGPDCPCTDIVKVTDSANVEVVVSPVSVDVICPITPKNPTIGPGGEICFQGSSVCDEPPIYIWSVNSSIGSTIDAEGCYLAGRGFTACEEATDTIWLQTGCPNPEYPENPTVEWKYKSTSVTIPPCVVTITSDPEPAEVETGSGETILFTPGKLLEECYEGESGGCPSANCLCNYVNPDVCYTWEVSDGNGNITDASGPTYTWSESDVGTTVTLIDTCNNAVSEAVVVGVISTSTTTSIGPECTSDTYCFDGRFCNGVERCVGGMCQPGSDPCPDDGLFCNGDEGCDEGEAVCTQGDDPCAPDLICDEEEDACVECLDDADCDDNGLFCDGEETCDEENGECVSSGDPCSEPTPMCDEDLDRCVGPGPACDISIEPETAEVVSGQTLSLTITPEGDCSDPNYEWSVESDIGSAIDQNGNYTAGINFDFSNEVTDTVKVVDHGNSDISAEATVAVSWGCSLLQIYGENSDEIKILRSLRDNLLSKTPEGQEIIRLYYQWSPAVVKAMEEDEEFKERLKILIDGILPLLRGEVE